MPFYASAIAIAAPPERVWAVLVAVEHWPTWCPTVERVSPRGTGPLAVGARYELVQPKLRPAEWVVTLVEPPRRFTWETRSPGVRVVADHQVAATAEGSTVTLRVTFSGWLGRGVGWLAGKLTQDYMEQEAAALRRSVEGPHKENTLPIPTNRQGEVHS